MKLVSEWLTYAQAAARFNVSAEAVRQVAIRRKWPRRKSNDDPHGPVQVLVPDDAEIRSRTPVERPSNTRTIGALETAIVTLREQLTAVRTDLDKAHARADRADAEVRELHIRAAMANRAEAYAEGLKAARRSGRFAAWWRARFQQ